MKKFWVSGLGTKSLDHDSPLRAFLPVEFNNATVEQLQGEFEKVVELNVVENSDLSVKSASTQVFNAGVPGDYWFAMETKQGEESKLDHLTWKVGEVDIDPSQSFETKSYGTLWIPLSEYRAGGEIKGFVFVRYFNSLTGKIGFLPSKTSSMSIELYEDDERKKIVSVSQGNGELGKDDVVFPFTIPIEPYAASGKWQLRLTDGSRNLDTKSFVIKDYEKSDLDIKVYSNPKIWLLSDERGAKVKVQFNYFFGTPLNYIRGTLKIFKVLPNDTRREIFSYKIDQNLTSTKGLYEFDYHRERGKEEGKYQWEISVQDDQGRAGFISGQFSVMKKQNSCSVQVLKDDKIVGTAENPLVLDDDIVIKVITQDNIGGPVPNVGISILLPGEGRYWDRVDKESSATSGKSDNALLLKTNEKGECRIGVRFLSENFHVLVNSGSNATLEPILLLVEAHFKQGEQIETMNMDSLLHLKLPPAPGTISYYFDKISYLPGDNVALTVKYHPNSNDSKKVQQLAMTLDLLTPKELLHSRSFWITEKVNKAQEKPWETKINLSLSSENQLPHQIRLGIVPETSEEHLKETIFLIPLNYHGSKKIQDDIHNCSVVTPKQVKTSEPIPVTLKFNKNQGLPAEPGQFMVFAVDRRLPAHTKKNEIIEQWKKLFEGENSPDPQFPKFVKKLSSSIPEWNIIKSQSVWVNDVVMYTDGGQDSHHWELVMVLEVSGRAYPRWDKHIGRLIAIRFDPTSEEANSYNRKFKQYRQNLVKACLSRSSFQPNDVIEVLSKLKLVDQIQILSIKEYQMQTKLLASWSRDGTVIPILLDLRSRLSQLTNNYIKAEDEQLLRDKENYKLNKIRRVNEKAYRKLQDLLARAPYDSILQALNDVLRRLDAPKPRIVAKRSNFVEVDYRCISFQPGVEELTVTFEKGSDAITEYEFFCFAMTESSVWCGKSNPNPGESVGQIPVVTVKNDFFTIIKNPAQLVFGDKSSIRTIITNTTDNYLDLVDLFLQIEKGIALNGETSKTVNKQIKLNPHSAELIVWDIKATKVGDVKLQFKMDIPKFNFTEIITCLDTPMKILPPGIPSIETQKFSMDSKRSLCKYQPTLSGKEVFTLGIVSVLIQNNVFPGIPLGTPLIEGLESLCRYPYGCCEQTYSSTLPNYIVWKYLNSTDSGSTKSSFQIQLEDRMKAGKDLLLSSYYKPGTGGFSLWSTGSASCFHTALSLSLLSLINSTQVPSLQTADSILQKSSQYLASQIQPEGYWKVQRQTYDRPWPESASMSDLAFTCFIFHACALAGIPLISTVKYLKHNLLSSSVAKGCKSQMTCIALILDALSQPIYAQDLATHELFLLNLGNVIWSNQNPNGSWSDDYVKKGADVEESNKKEVNSLTGTIECTAYCVIALAHAFKDKKQDVLEKGIDYLMSQRKAETGWNSTRDTLYASWAIGEAGAVIWTGLPDDSWVKLSFNDKLIKEVKLNNKTQSKVEVLSKLCELRETFVDEIETKQGKNDNEMKVEVSNNGVKAQVIFESRKYYEVPNSSNQTLQEKTKETDLKRIGTVEAQWNQSSYKVGEKAWLDVYFKPNTVSSEEEEEAEEKLQAVMMEIGIPAGMEIDDVSKVEKPSRFEHVELNKVKERKISVFSSSLEKKEKYRVTVPFAVEFAGESVMNPIQVFEMYSPHNRAVSDLKRIIVA